MKTPVTVIAVAALCLAASGCSNKKLLKEQEQQISDLQAEVEDLHGQLDAERDRSAQLNAELSEALADQRAQEQAWMEQRDNMTRITLDGEVTFNSGSSRISDNGREMVERIFDVLQNYPDRDVLIEGHTDDVAIAEKWQYRYKSNWELSSARAHAVLHFVVQKYGMDPGRIAAVGYGEYRPIATNETPEGRSANRRVVITVGPRGQTKALP